MFAVPAGTFSSTRRTDLAVFDAIGRIRTGHRKEHLSYDSEIALDDYLASEIVLDCVEGIFDRREALRRLMLMGVTAPAAAALLAACGSDGETVVSTASSSASATVAPATGGVTSPGTTSPPAATQSAASEAATTSDKSPDTSGLRANGVPEEVTFAGPNGDLIGLFAGTSDASGSVLVIHENRGLTAHIRSIPQRLAGDGYNALAIDLLSEEGGTASLPSESDATAALSKAPAERMIADMRAGLDFLQQRAPNAKLAVIGFCFGGGMTWQLLAAGEPRISAAVPFYGPAPADPDFSGSPNAAVLGIYAELDSRVNASQDTARAALEAAGLVHEIRVFPGVDHAFFNDTGTRYNAEQAYKAMIAWFGQYLGPPAFDPNAPPPTGV